MAGTEQRSKRRFVDADEREAVGALVGIIREVRPHVVVSYDPGGGYGHPDHVHTHKVTAAAVAAADTSDFPGDPWTVPKVYWTVFGLSAFRAAKQDLAAEDLRPEWVMPPDEVPFAFPDERIDAVVEGDSHAQAAKAAALAAHATQVTVGPTGRACALSNNMALPIAAQEHYVLAAGVAGDRDERGWETDLLAGLGFTGYGT